MFVARRVERLPEPVLDTRQMSLMCPDEQIGLVMAASHKPQQQDLYINNTNNNFFGNGGNEVTDSNRGLNFEKV